MNAADTWRCMGWLTSWMNMTRWLDLRLGEIFCVCVSLLEP